MTEKQVKELALKLCKAESEDDVIEILKLYNLWNPIHWKYFGQNENNYSTIGNQQSDAIAALIEKLINGADAILMKECLKRGISPNDSVKAPVSTKKALEEFFNIKDGDICNLTDKELRKLSSDNLLLVATSKDGRYKNFKPCLMIIDDGEGQFPNTMEDTFLSIGKSNKLSINFVQGKFNMGGTGVLPFCGNNKIQLIITKRHTDIVKDSDNEFKDYWGITVVRKQEPQHGQRSSAYTYLAPEGEILKFKSDELIIKPDIDNSQECIPYKKPMKCGTLIKLYNYDMKSCGKRKITNTDGLTDKLNMMISKAAIPIRLVECRGKKDEDEGGRTKQHTVKGYEARLRSKGKVEKNIEDNFPLTTNIDNNKQKIELTIYAFKEGKHSSYKKPGQGIVFTVNGQTQGFISDSIFTRKKIGLEYIKDSIFVIADCTNIETKYLEELFMNSRDRLRESDFAQGIENAIVDALSENFALKQLQDNRKKENLKNKTADNKLLFENINTLLKKNPDLKSILNLGKGIVTEEEVDINIDLEDKDDNRADFEGKDYPTFFRLKSIKKDGNIERSLGKKFTIKIETDVKNGFFDKEYGRGKLIIKKEDNEISNFRFNLDRGIIDLSIDIGKSIKVNDLVRYRFEIVTLENHKFEEEFNILFRAPKSRKRSSNTKNSDNTVKDKILKVEDKFSLPDIIEVKKSDFEKHNMTSETSLKIVRGDGTQFLINMDNKFINDYLDKEKDSIKKEKMLNKYKMTTVLYGIAILNNTEKNNIYNENYEYFKETIDISSKALAQVCFAIDVIYKQLDLDK